MTLRSFGAALLAALLSFAPLAASAQTTQLGSGIEQSHFDEDVRPQDDFYRHVNGIWLQELEIPADRSNYGSFTELAEQAEKDLRAIIEEAAATDAADGTVMQKVGDFYLSFMDSSRANALGLEPLRPDLERIERIGDRSDLLSHFAYARRNSIGGPFSMWVSQDAKDATSYLLYFSQSGLGMPDRDYYLTEKFADQREAYLSYVEQMLEMAGSEDAAAGAEAILDLETRLAEDQWTRVQNRDRNARYNKYMVTEAEELTPAIDWSLYLDEAGLSDVDSFVLSQPSYFEALGAALDEVPLSTWKTYLRFHTLDDAAPYLSDEFVDAHFAFHGTTLSGVEQNRPRWKRAISATNGVLGEMVGKLYVERHFPEEAKLRMDELVENLRTAFRQSIKELDWMTAETKQEALDKLEKFTPKIGYPAKWKDYSDLEIREGDLLGNLQRSAVMEYERNIDKLGGPIQRHEWFMTPQTVNAYYNPAMNEIVFPAAILQPPFFNVEADDAVNYGAIGAVIGHEFSHGFDDQGRKSDGDGNLRDWWTEEDGRAFEKRAQQLVDQYDAYSPIDSMHVDGELTLGENIADLAGLTMAYRAYQISLEGEEAPVIDGLTGDERFLMGWAQVWRRAYRDNELKRRLITDPHSPSEYRTNGIVANMPLFYEVYDVQPDDEMYIAPEDRVEIW